MERRRALPSWMSTEEEKKKEKMKEPLKRCRKRKVAKTVFYCMNERELVEAAVSCLTSSARQDVAVSTDHQEQVGNKAGDTGAMREKPASLKTNLKHAADVSDEDSSCCGDDLETTYISETDMNITEVETLPYTERSPLHQKNPAPEVVTQGPSDVMGVEVEAEQTREAPQMKAEAQEEDEALRLVREIFFT